MKTLTLAICLLASVAALSACDATTHSTETTTHGGAMMEHKVTK